MTVFSYKLTLKQTKLNAMQTKLSQVSAAYTAGDYRRALSIAAKFSDLGEHRKAITLASECFTNPRFYCQMVDVEQSKADGIHALAIRYGFA